MPTTGKGRAPRKFNKKHRKPRPQLNKLSVGAPQSVIRKLRYQRPASMISGALGVADVDVYRLNSLYDPEVGADPHQPRFFEQYMELYRKYVVLGAKVTLQALNTSTIEQTRIGMTIQDGSNTQSTGDAYIENERLQKNAILGVEGGKSSKTLTLNFSTKKWFRHDSVIDERDMEGTLTADPVTKAYIHVWTDNPWGLSVSNGVRYIITIDYLVMFRSPVDVPSSTQ